MSEFGFCGCFIEKQDELKKLMKVLEAVEDADETEETSKRSRKLPKKLQDAQPASKEEKTNVTDKKAKVRCILGKCYDFNALYYKQFVIIQLHSYEKETLHVKLIIQQPCNF